MSATAPQSQSPDSSASSPGQNRSPRQHGLEPSSSEAYTGDNATTERATEAVTAGSGRSDADGIPDWLADMRRVKLNINALLVISSLVAGKSSELTRGSLCQLYELIGDRQTDRGTCQCTCIYDEEVDQASIVVRGESSDVELIRREIHVNDVYHRQQEARIVWAEPDGTDYALSFQEVDGCAETWDFIVEVQRHLRGKLGLPGNPSSSRHPFNRRAIGRFHFIRGIIVTKYQVPDIARTLWLS